jgi:hypothetical protein
MLYDDKVGTVILRCPHEDDGMALEVRSGLCQYSGVQPHEARGREEANHRQAPTFEAADQILGLGMGLDLKIGAVEWFCERTWGNWARQVLVNRTVVGPGRLVWLTIPAQHGPCRG